MRRYLVQIAHRTTPDILSYWYGPRHGWGTTSGPLADAAVARFSSRAAAESALRSVFATLAAAKRRGYHIVPAPHPGAS